MQSVCPCEIVIIDSSSSSENEKTNRDNNNDRKQQQHPQQTETEKVWKAIIIVATSLLAIIFLVALVLFSYSSSTTMSDIIEDSSSSTGKNSNINEKNKNKFLLEHQQQIHQLPGESTSEFLHRIAHEQELSAKNNYKNNNNNNQDYSKLDRKQRDKYLRWMQEQKKFEIEQEKKLTAPPTSLHREFLPDEVIPAGPMRRVGRHWNDYFPPPANKLSGYGFSPPSKKDFPARGNNGEEIDELYAETQYRESVKDEEDLILQQKIVARPKISKILDGGSNIRSLEKVVHEMTHPPAHGGAVQAPQTVFIKKVSSQGLPISHDLTPHRGQALQMHFVKQKKSSSQKASVQYPKR